MEQSESPQWPVGGGEMGAIIRAHDWSSTSLGPLGTWSPSLKAATDILLRLPMAAVLLWDHNAGTVLYNDVYIAYAGIQHPQLLGSRVGQFPSEPAHFAANLLQIMAGGAAHTDRGVEFKLRRDGQDEQVWRNVDYSPVLDADGHPAGMLVIFLETVKDAAAAMRLRASEDATRTLNSITDGFMVVDANSRFLYVNPAARSMLAEQGIDADDGIGKQYLTEVFKEAREDASGRAFLRAMADRAPATVENYYAPFNRWYAIRLFPSDDGGLTFVIQDITERKRAEEALRQSEARFRALAEASPALIAMVDPDANVVYMNQRHIEIFGEDWLTLMGAGWRTAFHPDDAPTVIPALEQALRMRSRFQQRSRVKSSRGDWRWVESYGLPWYTDGGQYAGHVFVALDITQTVQAELALKEADKRKDEFLATLAHELRNPLAPICNLMPLMGRPGGARAADRLQPVIQRQVQQLVRLVDDLMDVSRVTRGKIELRKEPVELADVVRTAIEESQPLLDSARHRLHVSVPAIPLMLDADPVRLTQVFANLINNAARYTQDGGEIWLTLCGDDADAVVSVRDNGIGIERDMLPRVFEMFAQETHSSGASQGGLGIGLTLVEQLVKMHGGSVTAQSAGLGQGSQFTVRLPLSGQSRLEHGATPGGPGRVLGGRRVLVVDDNPDAAESLAMLLDFLGASTQVVDNGPAALATLETFRPDVVLMDIGMPGMSGHEVAQRIRGQAQFDGIKLIAVSGWGLASDRQSSHDSGFDHHLTKPVDLAELQALLLGGRNIPASP